jgi:hypothetical protein
MAMNLENGINAIIEKYNAWKASGSDKLPLFLIAFGTGSGLKLKPLGLATSVLYRKKDSPTNELDIMVSDKFDPKDYDYVSIKDEYDIFTLTIDADHDPTLFMNTYELSDTYMSSYGDISFDKLHYVPNGGLLLNFEGDEYDPRTYGVSIRDYIPTNITQRQKFENWITVRQTGNLDYAKTCEPRGDYPLLKLKEIMDDIVARNGAIILYNDAWWNNVGYEGLFRSNMYLEDMCEFANIIWSLASRQNIWFIYRSFLNARILTPWDEGLMGPRSFLLGYGEGKAEGKKDEEFQTFDAFTESGIKGIEKHLKLMKPRIGVTEDEKSVFTTADGYEKRKFIAYAGGKTRRRKQVKRRQNKKNTTRRS